MAIDIPKEVKKQGRPEIIFISAIFIVILAITVWSVFLKEKEPDEPKEIPSAVQFETFRRIPKINTELLTDRSLFQLSVFEKIPPHYCKMEETDGPIISEENCSEEPECFWERKDEICYQLPGRDNPFLPL